MVVPRELSDTEEALMKHLTVHEDRIHSIESTTREQASWKDHHISFLEFFPIILGLGLWCSQNKRVVFITDNESIINKGDSIINKGDSIDTIKLTLRHYKHSNPAEPVNIFIYQAQPVCPVTLLLAYLNLR